jgi:predicted NBD/HSP70 family sugar kinase
VAMVTTAVDGACGEARVERDQLHQLVIGTPGAFDPGTQRLRYARHLPGWHEPELLSQLRDALGLVVEVENDVNLAALAELSLGVARDVDNFVLLWGEEGVGAALVIDGRLHRGFTGGAGEVGFLPVPGTPLVRNVGINNAGGFQELVGAKAVLALAREQGIRASTAEAAVSAAVTGGADAFLAELGHRLAVGLAAIVSVIDPELVVLSGGVIAEGGDRLRGMVQDELHDLSLSRARIERTGVPTAPVLQGAMQAALQSTRDVVFNTATQLRETDRRPPWRAEPETLPQQR